MRKPQQARVIHHQARPPNTRTFKPRVFLLVINLLIVLGLLLSPQGPQVSRLRAATVVPKKVATYQSEITVGFEPIATWHESAVTLHFADSTKGFQGSVEMSTRAAFESWNNSGAQIPYFLFEAGGDYQPSLKPDGVNAVMFAPIEFPGHENDLAITIAFSNPTTLELTEADIVLNTRHEFSTHIGKLYGVQPEADSCAGQYRSQDCATVYDLENVLAHEVGHFLGLGENYDDPRSTMFSCTSACENHKRDISPIDQEIVRAAYAGRVTSLPMPQCGLGPSQLLHTKRQRMLPIVGSILLLLLVAWRRRLET